MGRMRSMTHFFPMAWVRHGKNNNKKQTFKTWFFGNINVFFDCQWCLCVFYAPMTNCQTEFVNSCTKTPLKSGHEGTWAKPKPQSLIWLTSWSLPQPVGTDVNTTAPANWEKYYFMCCLPTSLLSLSWAETYHQSQCAKCTMRGSHEPHSRWRIKGKKKKEVEMKLKITRKTCHLQW